MRTSTLAMVVSIGSMIAPPVLAQQQTVPNPQMQEEADKGAKTHQCGKSGYVGEQEKSGRFCPCSWTDRRQPADDGLDQWNRAALRRLERARNLAKHELEKRDRSSFSIMRSAISRTLRAALSGRRRTGGWAFHFNLIVHFRPVDVARQ